MTDYNYVLKYLICGHIEKVAIFDKTEITTQMRQKNKVKIQIVTLVLLYNLCSVFFPQPLGLL